MLWDDVPTTLDATVVARACDAALLAEAQGALLTTVASELKKRGDALRTADLPVGQLLVADGLACDLMLTRDEGYRRWGPLGPMAEWHDAGVYPPPVESFPESLKPYFEARADRTARADLRARYSDLLWLRWRSFAHARIARAAYVEAASNPDFTDATSTMTAAEYLTRASDLSLRYSIEQAATIEAVRSAVLAGIAADEDGFATTLADGCADLLRKDDGVTRALLDAILSAAASAPEHRRYRERSLLESAESLARTIGDRDVAVRCRRARAESLEAEANERQAEGGLIEMVLLKDALDLYADLGASADVQRLKPAVAMASERSVQEMHTLEGTLTLPRADFEAATDRLVTRLGDGVELALGAADFLGMWQTPEKIEASLDRAIANHPFTFLARRMSVSGDGRFQAEPTTEAERRQAQMVGQLANDTSVRLAVVEVEIGILRDRGLWSAERLTAALEAVDPPLAASCREGFEYYAEGKGWAATHLLIPQLERAVRLVALSVGVVPMARHAGGLRWSSLELTLGEPLVRQALGPALATALGGLFIDPYGPNHRNEIAHGASDPADDHNAIAFLTTLALLSVALRLAMARQQAAPAQDANADAPGPETERDDPSVAQQG